MQPKWQFEGDPDNPDQEIHNVIWSITKDTTGFYVAHNKVFGIILQAEDEDKLGELVNDALNLMWVNFPDVHDRLYPHHPTAKIGAKAFREKARFSQAIMVAHPRR